MATEILPNLWLGNINAATDSDFLLSNRISCVINCTHNRPFPDINCKKIRVPVKDNGKEEEMDYFYSIMDKVVTMLYGLLHGHRVLVYCYAGRQRSVAVVLAFLMKYCHFTLQEAIDTLRTKREDIIGINFTKTLVQYQLYLGYIK